MFKILFAYLLIYSGVHAVFFHRVRVLFPGKWWVTSLVVLFLILMILSPLFSRILELKGNDFLARSVAYAGYYWMGFIFLAFVGCLLLYLFDLISWGAGTITPVTLPTLSGKMPVSGLIGLVVVLMVYGHFEALNLKVERIVVTTDKLPPHTKPIRIVQISDVHLGIINRERCLERIMDKVKAESPDMLVCTGDLVDGSMQNLMHLSGLISRFQPPYGKYAVTGNHEYYAGLDHAIEFMERSGFEVLRQEVRIVKNLINIAGVDDGGRLRSVDATTPLSSIQNNLFTLYLKHRPDISQETVGLYDLQLAGHTHNGQIFPFNYLVLLEFPLLKGYHELEKNSKIYINRGAGTWGPPVRILSPPEITVIELKRK
ncbi:MAG: metallophosphoesterase [Deltaproteobacteria bacterium]|nr:metallophosphoesterase [Deltaproteobacteria bacterium]